jgi:hypothetical protein
MAGVIIPTAKPLLLCEEIDVEGGMLNVYALFNALHPATYPHPHDLFCVFAQLSNGLGEMRMHFDIRRARDYHLIHTSATRMLQFLRRTQLIQVAVSFEGIRFEEPGVYLIELFCDNTWVADVALELTEENL